MMNNEVTSYQRRTTLTFDLDGYVYIFTSGIREDILRSVA